MFGACRYIPWDCGDGGTWARARCGVWAWANGGKGIKAGASPFRKLRQLGSNNWGELQSIFYDDFQGIGGIRGDQGLGFRGGRAGGHGQASGGGPFIET